jgi:hypothetical protein
VAGLKKELLSAEEAKRVYSVSMTKMKRTMEGLVAIEKERDAALSRCDEYKVHRINTLISCLRYALRLVAS